MRDSLADGTAYQLVGPRDAPAVVLIHGLGLNRETWEDHLPALSERYRVISYDLLGHGQSAPPPAKPSLTVFSEQLCGLLDWLGIASCSAVGFSLGGMINRRFAIDHADRVAALVILNSPHERSPEAQRLVEERARETGKDGPAATLDATIERWFTSEFREARPDFIDKVRKWVVANDPGIYTLCRQVLAGGVPELVRPDPPITIPTLVMTCENDRGSTPAMSHAIAGEIKGAETIIIPKLQHMGLVEAPTLFTRPMLKFLDVAIRCTK